MTEREGENYNRNQERVMQRWLFPTFQKQTDAQPLMEQCLHWKTKLPTPFFPYPIVGDKFYCWAWHSMVWTNLLAKWGICPCYVSSQPLAHPQKAMGGDRVGNRKAWVLCKHSSATAETAVCYQHILATDLKHSTMQTALKEVNCISARHSTGTHVLHTPLQCNFL